jgi:hypothetical protein
MIWTLLKVSPVSFYKTPHAPFFPIPIATVALFYLRVFVLAGVFSPPQKALP